MRAKSSSCEAEGVLDNNWSTRHILRKWYPGVLFVFYSKVESRVDMFYLSIPFVLFVCFFLEGSRSRASQVHHKQQNKKMKRKKYVRVAIVVQGCVD